MGITKHSLSVAAIVIFVFAFWSLYRIIATIAPDFSVYYVSTKNYLSHVNIYTARNMFTGLGYPPFTLVFFVPFVLLPYIWAQAIWIIASFIALLGSIYILLRLFDRASGENFLAVFICAFLSFPTRFTLGMGQSNLIALFFLVSLLYFLTKKNFHGSVISYVLLLILKPHLVVLSPIFLLYKKGRFLLVTMSVMVLLVIVTGYMLGWQNFITYFSYMVPRLTAFIGRDVYYNQGIQAFASRVFQFPFSMWFSYGMSITIVLFTLWSFYVKKVSLLDGLMISIPVYLMIEPLSWQHHYVFLLPTYMWLWVGMKRNRRMLFFLMVSYILVSINIKQPAQFIETIFSPLVLSHVLWGNVLVYMLCIMQINKKSVVNI